MDMEKELKNYEIGFLFIEETDEREVGDALKGYKAQILHEGIAKKIKLAYPIKKQTSAYFAFIQFSLDPELVKPLSDQIKLNKKVLRALIFSIPDKQLTKNKETRGEKAERPPREKRKLTEEVVKKNKPEIVDNELLEKKLEEILK
ncbi:hypothetical protein COV23_02225 [Candidatus Wolfebacteria bacterium CG10_big_fil_rev_8_21_14_0_10_31_9]|uniref:Small ribosomal subunit protein bS6 n=1 Tax=Candidatus Wolfebacteria bacterium CG10_big_fil_rev_8_21_14_0_10_31_9 TaxID=1975070 RepID=A0A2H0RBU1_9BACT|nr:MAG: hypothetical protein COV23_02225 [Candidatus Wolfebacteria bacterium CG10_big_fil_rev_8_21_14_0_10_31_9]